MNKTKKVIIFGCGGHAKSIANILFNSKKYKIINFVGNKIKSNKSLDMDFLLSQFKKKKLKIKIFPIHEKWIDIGLPKDYESLTNDK